MNTSELYDEFRQRVRDVSKPYFWTDTEVFRYMNEAYRMFVRLTGGIPDVTSDEAKIQVTAGEKFADISPLVLRVMTAQLASNGNVVNVVNSTDTGALTSRSDYGQVRSLASDNVEGPVRFMVIGLERTKVKLINVPVVNDTIEMEIYRLPLDKLTDKGQELPDVQEEHHIYLVDWMEHLAYLKHDADTFDPQASNAAEDRFKSYCSMAKGEWERFKHKTRTVSYGGL